MRCEIRRLGGLFVLFLCLCLCLRHFLMTMDWLAMYTQEQGNAGLAAQKMETE